jgi:hypothetical protein
VPASTRPSSAPHDRAGWGHDLDHDYDDVTEDLKLAMILGSVLEGRSGPMVNSGSSAMCGSTAGSLRTSSMWPEPPLPLTLPAESPRAAATYPRPAELSELAAKLAAAEAFVVVRPESNHSFPHRSRAHRPALHTVAGQAGDFVSYSGLGRGLRAVEQLRLMFADMQCVPVPTASASPNTGNSSIPTSPHGR